ncbi:hypothetical protein OUZ56_013153 [Daphnia magna]|uniref:G-protein coupled receptors family 1 profile domain-containing protein n=1 Tax=Daphnia magna TaxID=35525 RepID=A0ABQ9Z516_9CRUS|nr:hypothetical protein OUZ56_013153 [Daphnia magna]
MAFILQDTQVQSYMLMFIPKTPTMENISSINNRETIRYIASQKVNIPTSLNAFFGVVKLICSVTGLLINTSAILHIVRRSPLRITPANIFLLMVNLLYSPFLYSTMIEFIYSNWYPVQSVCQPLVGLAVVPRYYPFLNVWLALIDRYAAINHSVWYRETMTTPVACGIIFFTSTSAFLVNFLYAIGLDIHECANQTVLQQNSTKLTEDYSAKLISKMTNRKGQGDSCCTLNADLTNLVCISFIFMMCTAANLLAFSWRKWTSYESHKIDLSTITTIDDIGGTRRSTERVERGEVKENEKELSNNAVANAMPNRCFKKISNAIRTLDILNAVQFSLIASIYVFVTVLFLFFVHRYATGPHKGNEFIWATPSLQNLTLAFPVINSLASLIKSSWAPYATLMCHTKCISKIDKSSLMSHEEFLHESRKHYSINPNILLTSPRFLYWAFGISVLVLFVVTVLRHGHLRNQPTNVFRLAMAFSYLSVFIPDVIDFIYWFLFPVEYVCNGYVPVIYVNPAIVFVNVILTLADYYVANVIELIYLESEMSRYLISDIVSE